MTIQSKAVYRTLWVVMLTTLLSACGGSSGGSDPEPPPVVDDGGSTEEPPVVTETDDEGNTSFDLTLLQEALETIPLGELTDDEIAGLLWMREEEKLAGDVYSALFVEHGLPIFDNIASSEATHTAAVKLLLDRYQLDDPSEGLSAGEYNNVELQQLHDSLVARGSASLLDGLYVGAAIEELDIVDIESWEALIDDNEDIALVYSNLKKGSRNHLRAFYGRIIDNGGSYTPEYLSQEAFDAIVNSDMERG